MSLTASSSHLLSRGECVQDIDSLVYTLVEVHPNLYSRVGISEFMNYVDAVKKNLDDSISVVNLYEHIAPLVAMVGDSHTAINPPGMEILEHSPLMMPLMVKVEDDGFGLTVANSESILVGSKLISVNGVNVEDMIEWMLSFIGGEQRFYRLNLLNYYFPWLFQIRYGSARYDVEYRDPASHEIRQSTVDGIPYDEFAEMMVANGMPEHSQAFGYIVPEGADYALMDFSSCVGAEEMAALADSMVVDLREKSIRKLIIDIRENSGGNSAVGDSLLRRLSSVPFIQYEEVYCRVNPAIEKLFGDSIGNMVFFFRASDSDYEQPLPVERRFDGECVLLTSHKTFSSASSFARAFHHFGVGKVVGEETGGIDIHFGDIVPYALPNSGLETMISFKRFRLPGANDDAPSGTLPDLAVPATEALDAALRMLGSNR